MQLRGSSGRGRWEHCRGSGDTAENNLKLPARPLAPRVTALTTPVIVGRYPRYSRVLARDHAISCEGARNAGEMSLRRRM